MKKLDDKEVLRLMREVWDSKMKGILVEKEEIDVVVPVQGEKKFVVSKGLKVRHKESKIRYTVVSMSRDDVILKTPEAEEFSVPIEELEADYEIS
jgi:hypothetical protein